MTVEEKKERNRKYGAICARAKAMGIMQGDAIGAIMDIDSADQRFNLHAIYGRHGDTGKEQKETAQNTCSNRNISE